MVSSQCRIFPEVRCSLLEDVPLWESKMDYTATKALPSLQMRETPIGELLAAAAEGDSQAWSEIVDRYERLVWSVVRGYRLGEAASSDVCQTVWMRLVEHCDRIRDPERLPGWLSTTARNEALRLVRANKRTIPSEFEFDLVDETLPDLDASLIKEERMRRLVEAFGELEDGCQQLLRLLTTDPPLDYETIAELIGRSKGSIGPTRARCLEKLRRIIERHDPAERGSQEGPS